MFPLHKRIYSVLFFQIKIFILLLYRKNDFPKEKILLDIDLKIILLDYQNNFIEI